MTPNFTWQSKQTNSTRLDAAITESAPELSRTKINQMLRAGFVSVNGNSILKPAFTLSDGDVIDFDYEAYQATAVQKQPPQMPPILYEDHHVAVIDKLPNTVVHAGHGHLGDTLVETFKLHWPAIKTVGETDRNGIVHRLDKDTSGVLIVALTQLAYTQLTADLKERAIKRTYTALVDGHINPPDGIIDAPLMRSKNNPLKRTIDTAGKPARTIYKTLTQSKDTTLLKINLETGRTHQIRVHLASVGHPVCNDVLYGGRPLDNLKRQFLHATHIRFQHPHSREWIECTSELPLDLKSVLNQSTATEA